MKTLISNARVVLTDTILNGACVAFENGIITYVGREKIDAECEYDAQGAYLLAGFIDIHCHGGGGYDFMDASCEEMLKISDFHLSHGTTTLVATTLTDTWESIESSLKNFKKLGNERKTLHGVHLEGPWFSPLQCGAQSTDTMETPSPEKLAMLKEKYPFIERVSIAPEIDEGFKTGLYASKNSIIASIGHTDADFDTTVAAADNGYTLVTHLYSGMRGVVRKNAYREAGCVEGSLYDDRLVVETIADGKHLPASLLKLIYKIKGADKICLVTDATRGAGSPDGTTTVLGKLDGGTEVIIEDGVAKLFDRQSFAGSVATSDRLFRTVRELTGLPLYEISKMISATPAKAMGYTDRGKIEVGLRADLILMDEKLNINKIFLKGEEK